ncbi:hypothetical protein [Rhodococcus sp. WAY2]|uniref:hypothetical protein n=1 Tax=Rhodococcus sp. WAY2 TaxID=2663121 RepID=UPI00131F88E6|nr:hypothetical protein [Rhodococcus sp. WAY2]QHE73492.1 hypothetical protein GFS60_07152 [Rhodococcus sp. WAY2]
MTFKDPQQNRIPHERIRSSPVTQPGVHNTPKGEYMPLFMWIFYWLGLGGVPGTGPF